MSDQLRGLGDDAPQGWMLQQYEVPQPKGISAIMETLKEILGLGKVQSLLVELGKPVVFTRFVKEEEADRARQVEEQGAASLGDVARNVSMEEYSGRRQNGRPEEIFIDMLMGVSARRLSLTHIGLGPETRFFKWMDLDEMAYGGIAQFAGAEVIRDKDIPDEIMLLFAGPRAGGKPEEATFILKCHLFTNEDIEDKGEDDAGQRPPAEDHGGGDSPEGSSQPDGTVADGAGGVDGARGKRGPKKGQVSEGRPRAKGAAVDQRKPS